MSHSFERDLCHRWPPADWANVTLLAAISGGADSMALLRAAHSLAAGGTGRLVVVHFNHRLRGAESDADEAFVREHARQHHLPCEVGSAQFPSGQAIDEDSARRARYEFFCQAARKWGARYVATAHTADDQAETILHRILRGTGLDGLAGIPPSRQLLPGVGLVRPLLTVSRSAILEYLRALDQPFREDTTNAELRFTRNKLRHELIPELEREYNPRVREAIVRLGQLAEESQRVIADAARDLAQRAVASANQDGAIIRCDELQSAQTYLVRQLFLNVWRECGWGLRDMSRDHWEQLVELAVGKNIEVQRATFPGAVRAERMGDVLRLTDFPPQPDPNIQDG